MHTETDDEFLVIKDEDVVTKPTMIFRSVYRFLGFRHEYRRRYAETIVSLYSQESSRPRGRTQAWKQVRKAYSELLDAVEKHLSQEITDGGYK